VLPHHYIKNCKVASTQPGGQSYKLGGMLFMVCVVVFAGLRFLYTTNYVLLKKVLRTTYKAVSAPFVS